MLSSGSAVDNIARAHCCLLMSEESQPRIPGKWRMAEIYAQAAAKRRGEENMML